MPRILDATGEEDHPETIRGREDGLFDLAVKDDELLTQESIFSDEFSSRTREVYRSAENHRMAGELGEMPEDLFKRRNQTDNQLDEQMQEDMHAS